MRAGAWLAGRGLMHGVVAGEAELGLHRACTSHKSVLCLGVCQFSCQP